MCVQKEPRRFGGDDSQKHAVGGDGCQKHAVRSRQPAESMSPAEMMQPAEMQRSVKVKWTTQCDDRGQSRGQKGRVR